MRLQSQFHPGSDLNTIGVVNDLVGMSAGFHDFVGRVFSDLTSVKPPKDLNSLESDNMALPCI